MKLTVFKNLIYYLKVWFRTFLLSLSKAGTLRIEVFVRFVRGVMLVAIQIIFIKAILGNAESIGGWSEDEMYLLSGVFNFVNYISWSFFAMNLWRMEEKILKGDFDTLLLKPLSSIFSASFPEFFIDDAISGISGILLIGYFIVKHFASLTILNYVYGVIGIFCALVVWFSLELIFASLDFIQIKNGLREIKMAVTNIARFPINIWDSNIRLMFYTVFPIAFVSIVPSGLISGLYDWTYLLLSVLAALCILMSARAIWYFSLKRYTSAGG